MAVEPLKFEDIHLALRDLPGWSYKQHRLVKTFVFGDFKEAISFIVRLAFYAEEQQHHPELTNVYNRVTVALTTHEAGDRVTERDLRLARTIESFSWV